jgi:hypothetical protein
LQYGSSQVTGQEHDRRKKRKNSRAEAGDENLHMDLSPTPTMLVLPEPIRQDPLAGAGITGES